MRGGEIDLIVIKDQLLVFVEVKVINAVTELHDYVTGKKLHTLQKSIRYFLMQAEARQYKEFDVRVDVAFVRYGKLYDVYENVTI